MKVQSITLQAFITYAHKNHIASVTRAERFATNK
jgi:hypothetical protein